MAEVTVGYNSADDSSAIVGVRLHEDAPDNYFSLAALATLVLQAKQTHIFEVTYPQDAGATVTDAGMEFTYNGGGDDPSQYSIYAIQSAMPLDGSYPTWNDRDSGAAWATAGAKGSADRGASALATVTDWSSDSGAKVIGGAGVASYVQTQIRAGNPIRLGIYSDVAGIILDGPDATDGVRPYFYMDITPGGGGGGGTTLLGSMIGSAFIS